MPSLPPLEEYAYILKGVWERGILTHNGPLVQEFEATLCKQLKVPSFVAVTNGTIAIQMAIKALKIKGEIITTPFTWIATLSAIQWEGCTPVFCDIAPDTLNMDPLKIEPLITEKTVAILPVHVFGNPCDTQSIESISRRHGLRVIYDAAHALGSRTLNGESLLSQGDISATSLHSTKLLNTAEGGGCISRDPNLIEKLKRIRFFGHDDDKQIVEEGLNGKMTEVHAALGLANLKYLDDVIQDRKEKHQIYLNGLSDIGKIHFQKIYYGESNCSYFPILLESEDALLGVEQMLNENSIFPRRYFYPSVNTMDRVIEYQSTPISEDISRRILCLPLYWKLMRQDMDRIISLIRRHFGK